MLIVVYHVWILHENKQWRFLIDEAKRGRVLTLQSTTTVEDLKKVVSEEYEVDQRMVDVEFTYIPIELSGEYPPVDVKNERHMKNFVDYFKNKGLIRLCVTFKAREEMGNCQAVDAAVLVLQHPDGKIDRYYGPVSVAEIMRMYPTHYVSLIIPLPETNNIPATKTTVDENDKSRRKVVRFTRVKLLRPTENLVFGHAYRYEGYKGEEVCEDEEAS
ncbi:unnamed protein product [Cochlearia groenlandica]